MLGAEDANQPPRKRRMLTEEQRASLQEMNRERMRAARARETPQQTENRRRANRGCCESSTRSGNSSGNSCGGKLIMRERDLSVLRRLLTNPEDAEMLIMRRNGRRGLATSTKSRSSSRCHEGSPQNCSTCALCRLCSCLCGLWKYGCRLQKLWRAPIHGRTKAWKFRGQSHLL